jgi:hypothetical protein
MNLSVTHAVALTALALCALPVQAAIVDPAGDFLSAYAFPESDDLDVLSADGLYDPGTQTFTFIGTHAGPIGTTPTAAYVFGIDRGQGTVRLPAIADNVKFDSAVILFADGSALFADLLAGTPPSLLPADTVTIFGNTIQGTVAASLIPSAGFTPDQYTWNLWPRYLLDPNISDSYVSDFAPDNSNVLVVSVPEPQTWALTGLGIAFLGFAARRRSARRFAMD